MQTGELTMKSSLLGKLRNTTFPQTRPMAPVYEALQNSFQATEEAGGSDHEIRVEIVRLPDLLSDGVASPTDIIICDTGIGFDDDNTDSFFTADTIHKQDRGGRGNGRFLWLKTFDTVRIESHFRTKDGSVKRRSFEFERRENQSKPKPLPPLISEPRTCIRLEGLDEKLGNQLARDLEWFSDRILATFLPIFRRPDCPKVVLVEEGVEPLELNARFAETVSAAAPRRFSVKDRAFTLTSYRVRSPEQRDNLLVFAAGHREVKKERLATHIPGLDRKLDLQGGVGAVYIGFVEGKTLDDMVHTDRLAFTASDEPELDLIENEISLSAIRKAALEAVRTELASDLEQIGREKMEAVDKYVSWTAPEYRRLAATEQERLTDELPSNPRPSEIEAVIGKILIERQTQLKVEGEKLLMHPPDAQNDQAYLQQMEGFLDRFDELDHTALATHVIHRRVVLNLLDQALERNDETGRYQLEALVHRMVHPRFKTSDDVEFEEQNLWLLDDRLTYHDYLGSDKELRSVPQLGTDSASRPDLLAIFDRPLPFAESRDPYVAFSVIEFKRPGRPDYSDRTPLSQVFDVVRDIRNGTFKDRHGRPIEGVSKEAPAYCYVVCDETPQVKLGAQDAGGQPTPDGRGYFGWNPGLKIYFEIIPFEKLVSDALRRNRILFKKLKLPPGRLREKDR
jgi:hypothetical protein